MKFELLQVNYNDEYMQPSQVMYELDNANLIDAEAKPILLQELSVLFGECTATQLDNVWELEFDTFILHMWTEFNQCIFAIHFYPIGTLTQVHEIQSAFERAHLIYKLHKQIQFNTLYKIGLQTANQDIARELVKYI